MKLLKIDLAHAFLPLSLFFLVLMFIFRNQSFIQFELVIACAICYLAVAFVHHHFDKSLTLEIAIEYILIAALALIILQGILI